MKLPENFSILDQRQNYYLYADLTKQNSGDLTGGPLSLQWDGVLDPHFVISSVFYWLNVSVLLTAAANLIESSIDNINWLQMASLATAVGTSRSSISAAGGRFWRYRKTDGVGTISQLVLQFQISP